jgi:hypothetical protein
MPLGGLGSIYIAQGVQCEPWDQTNLKNGVDEILGGGGGTFLKMLMRGAHRGRVAPWWGRAAPPGSLSGSTLGGCLLESSRVVFVVVTFSSFSHFDPSFWFSGIILLKI